MSFKLPKLIATSVVRGSQQGESHGGVFTVDFETRTSEQHIDWNSQDIDWEGRGADRGLRGIAFDGDDIYIAASDELFCYDREFKLKYSKRNRYLKHCHEICRMERMLFLTSTGHDCLLAFDLDQQAFTWGFHLQKIEGAWSGFTFNPRKGSGPGVIVIHEIPGITPTVAKSANDVVERGFTVIMPDLVGTPGKAPSQIYLASSMAKICIAKEFTTMAMKKTSPVISWLRALARNLHAEVGGPGVGAVGMCFSGGFAR